VPVTVTVDGEFVALLLIVTEPFTEPADVGANCTVNVSDWFGFSVSPDETPLALTPAPETFTLLTVTLVFPVFVTVMLCVLLLFTFTLPKLAVVALKLSERVAATPVPLVEIESVEFCALLLIVTVPFEEPADVGAKLTLKVVVPFAAKVIGRFSPVTL
jgi:hypothetical protein